MDIRVIDSLEDLDRERAHWDRAFAADEHATVFMSWPWLRGWLESTTDPWMILAARDGDRSIGYFPLSIRGGKSSFRIDQLRELRMAGDPAADYAGFVCGKADEDRVIRAFADFVVTELSWDRMRLRDVFDPRIEPFGQSLARPSVTIEHAQGICCPRIALPGTWEEFERSRLSSETRRSLRKRLRDAEAQFTLTTSSDDLARDIDLVIGLAQSRQGDKADCDFEQFRSVFRECVRAGCASIVTLWKDQVPVASQGMFIDRKHRAIRVYLAGFDDRFAKLSPGRVLDALCIRQAIEQGMTEYDFLRGDEPYKFQFGAESRHNRNFQAVRHNVGSSTRIVFSRVRRSLRF